MLVRFGLSDYGQLQADQAFPGYARWDLSDRASSLYLLIGLGNLGRETLLSISLWVEVCNSVYTHPCIYAWIKDMYIDILICIYIYMHVYIEIYACAYVNHILIGIYIYRYINTYHTRLC